MRILISVLIVPLAAMTAVFLASAARLSLEAAGIEVGPKLLSFIPALSMGLAALLFTWPTRRRAKIAPYCLPFLAFFVPFLGSTVILSIYVFEPMGDAGCWPDRLSLGAHLAATFVAAHRWQLHRARDATNP